MDMRAIVVLFLFCCISGLYGASFPYKPYCLACVPSNCGRPRDPWDLLPGRTYGGSNSTRGRYPWHAIVYADGQPIGGGALVSLQLRPHHGLPRSRLSPNSASG
ncbi:hypothetical protein MRX96_012766 [Rhipicephalus microplus]